MEKVNRKIRLEHGGKLFLFYDEYGEDGNCKHKTMEFEDLVPPYYLHELDFELGDNVVLEDVFLFLNKDLAYWDLILGNNVGEYVKQSFEPVPVSEKNEKDEPRLERVYVCWIFKAKKSDGEKSINFPFPSFNGEGKHFGHTCNIGFGGDHIANLNKLPIEIRDNLTVYYDDFDRKFSLKTHPNAEDFFKSINRRSLLERIFPFWRRLKYWAECKISRKSYDFGKMNMTLFQFLYGIFYELSFCGPPSDRKEFFADLSKRVDGIKEGGSDGSGNEENL